MAGDSILNVSNFMLYDLILLGVFAIILGTFLYRKRKNVKKEGFLLLYRTKWGMKFIDSVGKKYKKLLGFLSYVSIGVGYLLMAGIIYLFGRILWIYAFHRDIVQAIKIPPIMPLVPYLPQMFQLDFLPPFYFTYWIIIIAVVAITHEFAHGIFMRRYGIKIKSTGFGFFPFFLPIFLAAFVEQDEKSMKKSSKFEQMAVLSAGTFANLLTAIFFLIILWIFFSLAFVPSGIVYNDYAYNLVNVSSIAMVNGIALQNPSYEEVLPLLEENKTFQNIKTRDSDYIGFRGVSQDGQYAYLYYDAPAVRNELESTIIKVNEITVTEVDEFSEELSKLSPGEFVTLTVIGDDGDAYNRDILLGEHPLNEKKPWLGIAFVDPSGSGILGKVYSAISSFRKPSVYYTPRFDGVSVFIYNLLWWLIIISISVALVNMLPVGIFDGGRFFYLTILAITKK